MPNMFSTSESSSINVVWMTVLISLLFFLGAYYGLSQQANERAREQQAHLTGEGAGLVGAPENNVVGVPVDTAPMADSTPGAEDDAAADAGEGEEGDFEEEVGPSLTYDVVEQPTFTLDTSHASFDPFQLLQRPPTKVKDANDWHGAPFIVSPPHLPSVGNGDAGSVADGTSGFGGSSRLGYLQYPSMVDGTVVFSSEGDLYLTRLPDEGKPTSGPDVMTAMKLTTTVGNALHPKLNPKSPHLLAYSATYSGVREVYLLDLRPCPPSAVVDENHVKMPMGAPGTPGGPALRLTYTPGGIVRVVGWDEEGTSILYAAYGEDTRALPDVRLFRLRLTGGDGDEAKGRAEDESPQTSGTVQAKTESSEEKTLDEKPAVTNGGKEWEEDDDDDGYTIAEAQKYVDKMAPPENPAKMARKQGQNQKSSGDNPKSTEKATKKDEEDARRRRLARQERQRRHLAELSARRPRRRLGKPSSVSSIVEPVPLAQATEGAYHTLSDGTECVYFTRFKQSSNTKRYVGGTAESLWAYCPERFDDLAVPLTGDYNGTSKSPSVYSNEDGTDLLLFMSDRAALLQSELNQAIDPEEHETEWVPSGMDLWAVPLPLSASGELGMPIRLTNVACQHGGLDLVEYVVDPATGGVLLRIGADLHHLSWQSLQDRLLDANGSFSATEPLPIAVYSDFSNMQERLLPLNIPSHLTGFDAYDTSYQTVSTLINVRGQSFVAPVEAENENEGYGGGGRNMPMRRYKVAPGTGGGGLTRVLATKHIPQPAKMSPVDSGERLALVLATDPLSPTGEHAFYIIRTDAMASPAFGFASLYEYTDSNVDDTGLPRPFLGGHLDTSLYETSINSEGSTMEGGLGSVYADTVKVSPCGRRFAFTNTDGRIVTATIPTSPLNELMGGLDTVLLPPENEVGEPLIGDSGTELVWSPGGRYLAIAHAARNQFKVISIADLGCPEDGNPIELGRIVQATTDRFNSFSPFWGHASKDIVAELWSKVLDPTKGDSGGRGATALLYLSDRDIKLQGATSPWGTRAPSPTFDIKTCVHALPLQSKDDATSLNEVNQFVQAPYGGGGAMEVAMEGLNELTLLLEMMEAQKAGTTTESVTVDVKDQIENATEPTEDGNNNSTDAPAAHPFVIDTPISFGKEKDNTFSFARTSYRLDHIPEGNYEKIVCQLADDPSLLLQTYTPTGYALTLFAIGDWPSDGTEQIPAPSEHKLQWVDMSTDGKYILTLYDKIKVTPRTAKDVLSLFADVKLEKNIARTDGLHLSIWPNLEFHQMYRDAWRMLRDYFYDPGMHSLDWEGIFERYLPLVDRCAKREELDDVLKQMIGELSALHTFVYGGEYASPYHGDAATEAINEVASLGAILQRSAEKRGYLVVDIPERDPDFHMIDGTPMYSPLSNQALRLSGQAGLKPGDVIVAVNQESVMDVPSIGHLLRNTAGESVRLDVLRMESTSKLRELREAQRQMLQTDGEEVTEGTLPEPLVVVPMTSNKNSDLAYSAWEWKTRRHAKSLAAEAGFSIGYIHLRAMSGAPSMDSFARGFYPDYDKDALIIDVRNNHGGNIDSWILDTLQRTAWMYWQGRSGNVTTDGSWDMQFAFRGHLVVLINEHTSSDGEGLARGVSELGLGKLVGKRTWGGGIWLSSDNRLVDGGIASAPELGTYNDNFGWGLGVEQMGVTPDVEVDNNPKSAFDGEDTQLERAISVLKEWLKEEPVVFPKDPGHRKDMNKREDVDDGCSVS